MHKDWLKEEDVLAFDDVVPFNPPPGQSARPRAMPMPPGSKPVPPLTFDRAATDDSIRHTTGRYDLTPYWSRRAIGDGRMATKPRNMEAVPCCIGAMRTSLQFSGRRVLCVSCKTIFRFGHPIGQAAVQIGQRRPR